MKRRQQIYILFLDRHKKLRVLSGPAAQSYYNKNFREQPPKPVQAIKGTVACLGHARGRVRIVITQADQKKMKKGEIIVSTMTTPQLMSAIKLAAAIITDEGGLTANAAIVSRELNIPCIVGTKIATQVLTDGDLVEVDANQGWIRKITKTP